MLRGNGGQDIFFSPGDHYRMFFLIQEGVERFGHRVLAFCLMANHPTGAAKALLKVLGKAPETALAALH